MLQHIQHPTSLVHRCRSVDRWRDPAEHKCVFGGRENKIKIKKERGNRWKPSEVVQQDWAIGQRTRMCWRITFTFIPHSFLLLSIHSIYRIFLNPFLEGIFLFFLSVYYFLGSWTIFISTQIPYSYAKFITDIFAAQRKKNSK